MSIDQRLVARRREVAEDRARRTVSRLVRFLVLLAVLGAGTWLMLSPLLSVKEVTTTGIVASSTHASLVDQGVVAGTPMILIRPEKVVESLETDPWVREASVELKWPGSVLVHVGERVPVAWLETVEGWDRRAVDGVALPPATEPDDSMPRALFASVARSDATGSTQVLGALEFAASLPEPLRPGTKIWGEPDGELWAEVSGYKVRLGRSIEMGEKAFSLAALLETAPAAGSLLNLIAPTNPAVAPPGAGAEPSADQP